MDAIKGIPEVFGVEDITWKVNMVGAKLTIKHCDTHQFLVLVIKVVYFVDSCHFRLSERV